jgi:hypothetical protein
MPAILYRLTTIFAASLSLALAACSSTDPAQPPAPAGAQQAAAATEDEGIDTEATIWTVLGMADKPSKRFPGPQTGATVSPVLWQAAHDTLNFVEMASDDPAGGSMVTNWYSPRGKPSERFRVTVFILARALRTDSLAITIERQERISTGQWSETTVTRDLQNDLETAILQRAREIRQAYAAKPS